MSRKIDDHDLDSEDFEVSNDVTIVAAGRSPSGIDYFACQQGGKREWIPRAAFALPGDDAVHRLKAGGILLFGTTTKAELLKQAASITRFPPIEIMEQVGHGPNGCFAYPNRDVFTPDERTVPTAYPGGAVCVTQRGTLEQWQEHVLPLVLGQFLPLFAIFAAIAATLLSLTTIQGNFMFMYSGPPRKGKSTLIDLVASLCGPAVDDGGGRYLRKFNNTMFRIEELLTLYNDLPMPIDELSGMGSTRSIQTDFRWFSHHLTGVDARGRLRDPLEPAKQTRTVYQISSNDMLSELLRNESDDAAAGVEDRIFEIPIPRGDEGVFNAVHPAFETTADLAFAITEAVKEYHGTFMPAFLRKLVAHRAKDPRRFQAGLMQRIHAFATLPAVTRFGPVSPRKLRAFGLVYAGALLAKRYGLVPREVDAAAVVVHCLGLNLGRRVEADPTQRLLSWFATNTVIDLRGVDTRSMSTLRLDRRGAFIGECRGEPELLMRPKLFRRSFTNSGSLLRQLRQRGVLDAEGRGGEAHYARKRTVRRGKADRVFVFQIPDLEEWLEKNGHPRPRGRKRSM